jgi:hypothetical protein
VQFGPFSNSSLGSADRKMYSSQGVKRTRNERYPIGLVPVGKQPYYGTA